MVRLDPVTSDNLRAVYRLAVASGQEDFVAPNSWSLAEAYTEYARHGHARSSPTTRRSGS